LEIRNVLTNIWIMKNGIINGTNERGRHSWWTRMDEWAVPGLKSSMRDSETRIGTIGGDAKNWWERASLRGLVKSESL
jgi:hypothetical protein